MTAAAADRNATEHNATEHNATEHAAAAAAAAPVYAGVDVSKAKLDLATDGRADAPVRTVDNTPAGHAAVVAALRATGRPVARVVVEATGGLERPLVDALLDAGLTVCTVNPARARSLAKTLGREAKTDAVDARVLATFARVVEDARPAERRSPARVEIEALVTCRRQLVATRTEQSNRRGTTTSKAAVKAIDAVLRTVDRQLKALAKRVAELVAADDDFRDLDRRLREVPGVGPVASATLIAGLPELGKVDAKQLAALVGVAPFADASGPRDGPRHCRGGRADVRSVLYMAAVSATAHNPVIRAFADGLRARGKSGKVVVIAALHKLLTLLNVMARDGLSWGQLKANQTA